MPLAVLTEARCIHIDVSNIASGELDQLALQFYYSSLLGSADMVAWVRKLIGTKRKLGVAL